MSKNQFGLTAQQVAESREQHGRNVLTPPKKTPLWRQFLEKFKDPIIRILLLALLASVGISLFEFLSEGERHGSWDVFFEPAGIFVAVILATGIGFWFEVKAGRAFDLLNAVSDEDLVQVVRDGSVTEVPKADIVVGDIVVLNAGAEVPADGELLESVSLQMNESTLTGEPIVKKSANPADADPDATYPTNMALRGTTVVDGHGVMQVTAVGDQTENGKVFTAAQIDNSVKTPLNHQLDRLGNIISRISYVLAALIIVGRVGLYLWGMTSFNLLDFSAMALQSIMVAVTLVVVAVPEGLPMAVTLSLALSMRRMLQTNNLVRKMHACETMGATTVICTDKTGTLTQNQMRVHQMECFLSAPLPHTDARPQAVLHEGMAVNSTAFLQQDAGEGHKVIGNPTEGALLLWLTAEGADYEALREAAPVESQLTFSTERKYMATVVRSAALGGRRVLYVKGAPEIVCGLCREIAGGVDRAYIDERLAYYQGKAMRTLGFACQILEDGDATFDDRQVLATRLTFLGICGIADPVRSDVPQAVGSCIDAGINIKIVTGDTPGTAREIARQIGLWQEGDGPANEITGPAFAALSDEELEQRILDFKVISRARPMDKKRLVETLQKKGQVVAVTGDGTNDAPALKAAQVGLSMGDGTSVAKEASDITIMDNSFASITRAVMWGRSLYRNIQRFILFQMTINVCACLIVLIGSFTGLDSPLNVTQMLWVNLIMDTFAAMALSSLPANKRVLNDPPRHPDSHIITRPMGWQILSVGILFFIILVGMWQLLWHSDVAAVSDLLDGDELSLMVTGFFDLSKNKAHLSPYELSLFFTFFVLLQFWNLFNARYFRTSRSLIQDLLGLFTHDPESREAFSRSFLSIALVILLGQVLIVTFLGEMFSVAPLSSSDWGWLLLLTSPVLLVADLKRFLFRQRK